MSSDFDFCETEGSIFAPGELLETRLASLDPTTCTQKTEVLEPEPDLDYFLLKEQGCIDGLVLWQGIANQR